MSFHETVAQKARADGGTSIQFRVAAQKHASATVGFLIFSAGAWYVLGWKWALIPFAVTVFVALQGISAKLVADKLEKYERTNADAS